jgi:hypothetical protein
VGLEHHVADYADVRVQAGRDADRARHGNTPLACQVDLKISQWVAGTILIAPLWNQSRFRAGEKEARGAGKNCDLPQG